MAGLLHPADRGLGRVSAFVVYAGSGVSGVDAKSRTTIPAELRDAVLESSGGSNEVHLVRHLEYKCLVGFGSNERDQRRSKIDSMQASAIGRGEQFVAEDAGIGSSSMYKMPFEASGRFVLNPMLGHFTGIAPDSRVFFFGVTTHFLLWNVDIFLAQAPDKFRAEREELDYWLNIHGKRSK